MKPILPTLCIFLSLAFEAQAQSKLETQSTVALGLSNAGQDITSGFSGGFKDGFSSVNFSLSTELHAEDAYNAFKFQIAHKSSFPLSQNESVAFTSSFMLDAHPEAHLAHYAISQRVALLSSLGRGLSLTTFVEFGIDRASIEEQDHATRKIGASLNVFTKDTSFELSSSVGALHYENAEAHATFSGSASIIHRFSEDIKFVASASVGRDLEKVLRDGIISRNITAQKNLSLSVTKTTSGMEFSPYVSFTDMQSAVFHEKDFVAGIRTTWTF